MRWLLALATNRNYLHVPVEKIGAEKLAHGDIAYEFELSMVIVFR